MNAHVLHHPKLLDFADAIFEHLQPQGFSFGQPLAKTIAVGLLERLWQFTTEYAPAGDIGKHSDRAIARAVGWEGEVDWLIETLVELRLLDRDEEYRLVVHDWSEHCDKSCHQHVADRGQQFADGGLPARKPRRNSPEGLRLKELAEPQERSDKDSRDSLRESNPARALSRQPTAHERQANSHDHKHRDDGGRSLLDREYERAMREISKNGPITPFIPDAELARSGDTARTR